MSSIDCNRYFPDPLWTLGGGNVAGECSGHGTCVNGFCICDEGWTGLSDFVNSDGFDCQINIVAFKCLWGILALAQVYGYVAAFPFLKARYLSFLDIREIKASKGESYTLRDNVGLLVMVIWYGFGAPLLFVLAIAKWTMDEERIGQTWLVTTLFLVVKQTFWLCVSLFQTSLLKAVVHDVKGAGVYVKYNNKLQLLFFVLQLVASLFAVACILNDQAQQQIYVSFLALMVCLAGYSSAQAWYMDRRLSATLMDSYSLSQQERTLVIKKKLNDMQAHPMKQGAVLAFLFFIQFIWPFFWNKHDYFLPISWLVMPIAGLRVSKTSLSSTEAKKLEAIDGKQHGPVAPTSSGPAGMSTTEATSEL